MKGNELFLKIQKQMKTNNTINRVNVRFKKISSREAEITDGWFFDLTLNKIDIVDYLEWDEFKKSSKIKFETYIKSIWQNTVVLMINFFNSWKVDNNKRIVLSLDDFYKIEDISKFVKLNI